MRVVLDSNVIIAAYAAEGLCHSLFELCLTTQTVILSEEILDEVCNKLAVKIHVPSGIIKEIDAFLRKNAILERPIKVAADRCRDPNDLKILGLAHSAQCVVSGDQDLLTLGSFDGIPILSPRQFYERLQAHPEGQVKR